MKKYLTSSKIAIIAISSLFAVSCSDTKLYDPDAVKSTTHNLEANDFDFSTVQQVNLTVDYSAFKTYGQVFFSVYSKNPFVGEGEDEHLDLNILPIYEDFTDGTGKFSRKIELPAFATRLFVVTGNYFVDQRMMEVDVVDGVARAVAVNNSFATRAGVTRGVGEQTNDLSTMPHLSYLVDEDGKLSKDEDGNNIQIYKEWLAPLGSWDAESGRPSYLLQPGDVSDDLLCSDEEIEGLFSAIGQALDENRPCSEEYRNYPDLTLEKNSQVTITMLGGSTCWNSTLGYYYYLPNDEPQKPEDLNVIMLFPNTQDGEWKNMKSNYSYRGNIALQRGDAVLLKYYPHIGEDGTLEQRLADETTEFPAGIKIGFILKANGWGMQGEQYTIQGFPDRNRKYNVWGASTDKTSYCKPFGQAGKAPYQYCNPNGESRSAKFAYKKVLKDGTVEKFAIVSFEDACNDQDYDDVIFALKPVNSFTPLPEIENKVTTTVGVYAFEDLWPSKGDYDLNDVVLDFKHQIFSSNKDDGKVFKIFKETFSVTTYQNYVELVSGLAFRLMTDDSPKPSSIVVKKKASNSDTEEVVETPSVSGNIYYLTPNVENEIGSTYTLELTYDNGITATNAKVQPFIYRWEEDDLGNRRTWEVHIPYEAPSPTFKKGYFGTDDDASNPDEGKYFVRSVKSGNYPFAYFLYGASIVPFQETILVRKNESRSIDTFFEKYPNWATTNGKENKDWYLYAKP
jgi:LruC domain-containing protein